MVAERKKPKLSGVIEIIAGVIKGVKDEKTKRVSQVWDVNGPALGDQNTAIVLRDACGGKDPLDLNNPLL